jgi:AcrR family transcriptional regulator
LPKAIAQVLGYARGRMGNREDLLAGAKRCLLEKGYDRTTVRDIRDAAGGVSMAAIGYHFGSREELLTAALVEALDEWGTKSLGAVLASGKTPMSRRAYEQAWDRMIASFQAQRALWLASMQAFLQGEHSPQIREQLAAGQEEGRRGVVAWLRGVDEAEVTPEQARGLGSVQMALITGLMTQWLNDPAHAPTGAEIARGLRELADAIEPATAKPAASRPTRKPGARRSRRRS